MGKNIFFVGLGFFLVGLASLTLPSILKSFSDMDTIEIKEESPENSQKKTGIPQKISSQEKITGEFYVNFTCPHCRSFYKNSLAPIRKEYTQEMDINIKNYPFLDMGLEMEVAKFFTCAKEQKEQFFVLDYFFFGKDEITELKTEEWISELELNPEKMTSCLETAGEKVLAEKSTGKEKGVRGAPTFFIEKGKNSEKFEGNIEKYQLEMKILPMVK